MNELEQTTDQPVNVEVVNQETINEHMLKVVAAAMAVTIINELTKSAIDKIKTRRELKKLQKSNIEKDQDVQ